MIKRLLYIINFILLLLIIYFGSSLYKISGPLLEQIKISTNPESISKRFVIDSKEVEVEEIELPEFTPASRSRYALIADKDLFRPEREEWYPPPPPEEEGENLVVPTGNYAAQQGLKELPKPLLYGIVIIGDNKKYAIMQGHIREEVEIPETKTRSGRPRRQSQRPRVKIEQDKARPYYIGEEISEYQIADILVDMIILEKNGVREELHLRQSLEIAGLDFPNDTDAQQFPQGGFPPGYNPQVQFPPGYIPQGAYPQQGMRPQGRIPRQPYPGQQYPPQGQIPQQGRNWPPQQQGIVPQGYPRQPVQRQQAFPQQRVPPGYFPPGGVQAPYPQSRQAMPVPGNFQPRGLPGGIPNNFNLGQQTPTRAPF